MVTQKEPEFLEEERAADLQWSPRYRRGNAEVVNAGLSYLLCRHQDRRWPERANRTSVLDALATAFVLSHLKDIPASLQSHKLQQKIHESLDWLLDTRTPGGGWPGASGDDEAGATAWAALALARNDRAIPEAALRFIRDCRRPDGGFATRPEGDHASALDTTAVAAQALGHIDGDAERFLCASLQSDEAGHAEQLTACALILDWEKGLVPLTLLNQACQITAHTRAESASEQALLLRCLLRLRLTRAWTLAESLRGTQHADGSWLGPATCAGSVVSDEANAVSTAAAVSALVLVDSQPGLYFGSDSPRPRRLNESRR